ncbi:uncharacterized protein LOC141913249 [Tubulanus polymorphus]|uniref:uncharacterized protein LOC141913249 n=1 Tax=Tubulanus polymorphus TaxID=672921 RepID=UPI003DA52DCD
MIIDSNRSSDPERKRNMHQPELPTCNFFCLPKSYQKAHLILGVAQIISGIVCLIANIVLLVLHSHVAVAGGAPGIWGGIIFVIAGGLGVRCRDGKIRCLTIGCMVISIISSVVVVIVMLVGGLGLYREDEANGGVPFYSLMFVFAMVEFVASIIESAYCCRLVCCRTTSSGGPNQRYQAVTLYANSPPGAPVDVSVYNSSIKRNTSQRSA